VLKLLLIMTADLQPPFDIAVVMTTVVRASMQQAIRSVFAQQFEGRIQILIGIDQWQGERALVDGLNAERPSHVAITIVDLGYSTSRRHGGLYPSRFGGALKTILSYAANSRHVTYLDDDNWYAPDHMTSMLKAVDGKAWAFSLRHFVERKTGEYLCPDTWESMGPGRGVYAEAQGGFVDANCFVLDTQACYDVFPEWAMTRFEGGTGGDRQILQRVADRPWGSNNAPTVFYRTGLKGKHPYILWRFRSAGVDLARFLPPESTPGEDVWRECAEFDRAKERSALETSAKSQLGEGEVRPTKAW
jgi:hypothetical protein